MSILLPADFAVTSAAGPPRDLDRRMRRAAASVAATPAARAHAAARRDPAPRSPRAPPQPAGAAYRLAHAIASALPGTWRIENPAIISFGSANGPSVQVRFQDPRVDREVEARERGRRRQRVNERTRPVPPGSWRAARPGSR